MLKIPNQLRVTRVGGVDVNSQMRKTGFQTQAPRFIVEVGHELGLCGTVIKEPGKKFESGCVELHSAEAVLRISEDPTDRTGLQLCVLPVAGPAVATAKVGEFKNDVDFEDWLYRVKKMLVANPEEGASSVA